MPSLEGYKSGLDYSYAPGVFPAMECLLHRPDSVRRVLVHSSAAGRDGAEKLTALAQKLGVRIEEADRALARISGKENCRMSCCTIRATAATPERSSGRHWDSAWRIWH